MKRLLFFYMLFPLALFSQGKIIEVGGEYPLDDAVLEYEEVLRAVEGRNTIDISVVFYENSTEWYGLFLEGSIFQRLGIKSGRVDVLFDMGSLSMYYDGRNLLKQGENTNLFINLTYGQSEILSTNSVVGIVIDGEVYSIDNKEYFVNAKKVADSLDMSELENF